MSIARSDWPRLLTLVEQALDMPAAHRVEWLHELDLPLALKSPLRRLIAQRSSIEADDFLAELPSLPDLAHLANVPGRFSSGALIGPWRLLKEIGQGGMSTVWLAERADEQLTRQVALKLPHAGPGQDVLAERLLRERNILASLEHPHIARLYDVGLTDAGTPYLVMEYVEGDSLLEHAESGKLTVPQRLILFRQVLQAVHFAHGKLVLHRDLKPGNILVNRAGEVKLLDFGIAKLLTSEGSSHAETELTRAAGRRLTPAYASPEQLRGDPLGTASDVYSLGLVLYELLCGQRPFAKPGMSAAQIEHAVLHLDPKPLHKPKITTELAQARGSSPTKLQWVLSGDLNAVLAKALANAPEERYASVDALDVDVTRWLAGRPVLAQAPSDWYYLSKFVRRNKLSVGVSAAALCALVATGTAALVQSHNATQQAARAGSVRDFLVGMFDETDLDRAQSSELTAKALLESGRVRATAMPQAPELRAELLTYIGKAQMNISDRLNAEKALAEAAAAYRSVKADRQELMVLLYRADNAVSLGQNDAAQALLTQADALAKTGAADPQAAALLFETQGMVAMFQGNQALAKSSYERYLALAETRPDTAPANLVNVLTPLAWVTSNLGNDLPAALALIERALAIVDAHPELPATHRLDVLKYRQVIAFDWGRYSEVLRSSPQDIRDCDRALSADSTICLRMRAQHQAALLRTGLVAQALALNDQLTFMLDPSSPRDQFQATAALARTLAWSGRIDRRSDLTQLLGEIAKPAPGSGMDTHYRLLALDALAEVELLRARPADALAWVAESDKLAASDSQRARPHASQKARLFEGMALHMLGRHAAALEAMRYFCTANERPADMARIQNHLFSLNCVPALDASGQSAAAIALIERALPVLREGLDADSPVILRARRWQDELRSTGRLSPPLSPAEILFS